MPTIQEVDASSRACPYNNFTPCMGSRCMAWQWIGPDADRCCTDNLTTTEQGIVPVGVPPMPEGGGWEADGPPRPKSYHRSKKEGLPLGLEQCWTRKRDVFKGNCARHPGDNYYGGF